MWSTGSSFWLRSSKWVQMLIFQLDIIIYSLYIKHSSQFCVFFTFLTNLVIFIGFAIDWEWLLYSHSMLCASQVLSPLYNFIIVAQWRNLSSESAVISYEMGYFTVCCLYELMWHLNDRNYGNAAINASNVQAYKLAVVFITFTSPLVLYRSPEPQEALWQ